MILNYFSGAYERPNRLKEEKNEDYHLRYAKYCLSSIDSHKYQEFLHKYEINKQFYKGKQWELDEDIEQFLKDETGQDRQRIKVIQNTIRPIVEQYKGNGKLMELDFELGEISPMTINRRERALAEKVVKQVAADLFPDFSNELKNKNGLGDTIEETAKIFQNYYNDDVKDGVNKIINYLESINRLANKKVRIAEHVALAGIGILFGQERGSILDARIVYPDDFFWDTAAKEQDFSDADFMGEVDYKVATDLIEEWMLNERDAEVLELYTETLSPNETYNNDDNLFTGARIPTAKVYWKDFEYKKFGYVTSKLTGEPVLKRIYDDPEDGEFTEKDLIDVPEDSDIKDKFRGDSKHCTLPIEVIRFCEFVPQELLAGSANQNGNKYNEFKDKNKDIIGRFGTLKYQEDDLTNPQYSKFPFKVYAWSYLDGEVLSPVDDAISPQRFLNRILSATEAQINNAGGAGTIIDEDAVPAQSTPDDVYRDMSNGRPVTVQTKGMGVQNVVTRYDNTPSAGLYKQFELIPLMSNIIKDVTGVNDALQGQGMGQDQLVGVTEALIQRGTLMQEPFYFAVEQIFEQMYQMFATVGKNIVIDKQDALVTAVGNRQGEIVKLSKDWKNEDFRLFLKRTTPEDQQHQMADQMLIQFLQLGLIDETMYANLYGRSTPQHVAKAIREHAIAKDMQARQQAQQQQKMQQQEQQQMQQALQLAEQKDTEDKIMSAQENAADHERKLEQQDNQTANKIDEIMAQKMAENIMGESKNQEKEGFKL